MDSIKNRLRVLLTITFGLLVALRLLIWALGDPLPEIWPFGKYAICIDVAVGVCAVWMWTEWAKKRQKK